MRRLLPLICLLFCVKLFAQQQKTESITIDDLKREFITYVPAGINDGDARPVIISLHGRLGTAESQIKFADFRPIADKEKIIVVCPQGVDRSWNDGRGTPAHDKGINDVKFIDELITYIIKTYNADPARVYVTGMSNGGFMTSRLACELSNRIAAIAVVAASMDKDAGYQPTKPMPVMYIQGTSDPLVPFEGGTMKKGAGGSIFGHHEVVMLWARTDKCRDSGIGANYIPQVKDGTSVTTMAWVDSSNHEMVIDYTVTGGGHTWPGGTQYLPKFMIGSVSHNLDACQVIWNFFKFIKLE